MSGCTYCRDAAVTSRNGEPLCGLASCASQSDAEAQYGREQHLLHLEAHEWHEGCAECVTDGEAIDWLLCVRRYGLDVANRLFP